MPDKRFTITERFGYGHRQGETFTDVRSREVSASTVRRLVADIGTYHNDHASRVRDETADGVRTVRGVHWNNGFENIRELHIVAVSA